MIIRHTIFRSTTYYTENLRLRNTTSAKIRMWT